jgi:hypothetical protein
LVGILTGMFLNPAYQLRREQAPDVVMELTKRPAVLEGKFKIEKLGAITPEEQAAAAIGLLMVILLERRRG